MSSVDGSGIVPEREADNQRALGSSYLIETVIGRGSTGEVWRARVRETDEPVAAKVLDAALTREPETVARFIRERALLTKVDHPNVVKVRDLVVEGDTLAIITDLVDGPSLRTVLDRNGTLRPGHAVEICGQILAGLQAVHEQGLIHRDLKPENVLVAEERNGEAEARIVDFGIAQLAHGDSANERGEIVGTAEYIAPELLEGGTPSPASDVYAVGIILYELVCGRTPFGSDDVITVIRRQLREPAGRPAGMPMELWAVLQQLLAKDPDRRPASAADARALLGGTAPAVRSLAPLPVAEEDDPVVIEGDETIITPRRKVQPEPEPPAPVVDRPRAKRWIAVGVAVALVAGTTAFFTLRSDPAAAATLQSATERPQLANGNPEVHRTLSIDGDELVVRLTVKNSPVVAYTLHEQIPRNVGHRNVTLSGRRAAVGSDGQLDIAIPASGARTVIREYRIPITSDQPSDAFLRRYERQRVQMLMRLKEDVRPETVLALEVPPAIRIPQGIRVWLPVSGQTSPATRAREVGEILGSAWHWTSTDPSVASVRSFESKNNLGGRQAGQRNFLIDSGRPGRAVLRTSLGGHDYAVRVQVKGTSDDGPPCDPGVLLPAGTDYLPKITGGHRHPVEGTLLEVKGRTLLSTGMQMVPYDLAPDANPCAGAPISAMSELAYNTAVMDPGAAKG